MNYSEYQIDKKIKSLASPRNKVKNRINLYGRVVFAALALALALFVFSCVAGVLRGLVDGAPDVDEIELMPTGYATSIYDEDGNVTQKLVGSDANRIYVSIDKIPKHVQHAFVAIEDARFYEHKGVDLQGIIRAVYSGIADGGKITQGASTITQQLLKNQVFGGGNEEGFFAKFFRKVQEQRLAVSLEASMDKDQILEYYLNTINLGQNTLGVEAASIRYFDKSVSDLTVSEAAVIAGITQNPTEYNPIANKENNADKRKLVLKAMLDQGYISEDEYEDALGDDVYAYIEEVNERKLSEKNTINSYYVDAVIDSVVRDLKQELGYTETQAYNAIYRKGLKIYSCQNRKLQKICDSVINDDGYYPDKTLKYLSYQLSVTDDSGVKAKYTENDIKDFFQTKKNKDVSLYFRNAKKAKRYIKKFKKAVLKKNVVMEDEKVSFIKQPQASFVLIEQSTGHVQAIVGGRGEKTADRTLNRATASKRQPGSTFKVPSTYLPALDTCGMTLATVEEDAPYKYPGTGIEVKNWDSSGYRGFITLRDAIVDSNNTVAVKTFEKVTPQTGYDYLLNLGITTLVDRRETSEGKVFTDISLPTALGGLTDGVTNLELTAAYACLANGGEYIEPVFYTKILDQNGDVLLSSEPEKRRVAKESSAWLLTSAMQDVIIRGTGAAARFVDLNMSQAGKSGTTSENTDYWFEGYTPYYTAGIWMGCDMNMPQESGDCHKRMWRDIMEKIHKKLKLPDKGFKMPGDVEAADICVKSGKLANPEACAGYRRTEYFAKGTRPSEMCDVHIAGGY